MWKKGGNGVRLFEGNNKNMGLYSYAVAKWKQSENIFGGQKSVFEFSDNNNRVLGQVDVNGRFNTTVSSKMPFVQEINGNRYAYNNSGKLYVYAGDWDWHTPRTKVTLYGVAMMYRRFNMRLDAPSSLSYRKFNGTYESKSPGSIQIGEGHSTRYYNESFQIKEVSQMNGILDKIEISETQGANTKSFNIYGSSNSFKLDQNFVNNIDGLNLPVSGGSKGDAYYNQVSVKPIYKYKDVQVKVLPASYGVFADGELAPGVYSNKYHAGDEFSFKGKANDGYRYVGYRLITYKNLGDTTGKDVTVADSDPMPYTLPSDISKIAIQPIFEEEQNCVEVILDNNAKGVVKVINALEDKDLPFSLKGKVVIESNAKQGENYQIQLYADNSSLTDDMVYRPIIRSGASSQEVRGMIYDHVVTSGLARDNKIYVSVEKVRKSDLKKFTISGTLQYDGTSIRSSSAENTVGGFISDVLCWRRIYRAE